MILNTDEQFCSTFTDNNAAITWYESMHILSVGTSHETVYLSRTAGVVQTCYACFELCNQDVDWILTCALTALHRRYDISWCTSEVLRLMTDKNPMTEHTSSLEYVCHVAAILACAVLGVLLSNDGAICLLTLVLYLSVLQGDFYSANFLFNFLNFT